jgi:glycine cleavage system H protein
LQGHLGEVVFVELPDNGASVLAGGSFGNVESVKATSDVNSPIAGEVVEVNSKLTETPGLVSPLTSIVHPLFSQSLDKLYSLTFFYAAMSRNYQINSSPYEDGWMIKVKPSNSGDLDSLLDAATYTKHCEEEDAH